MAKKTLKQKWGELFSATPIEGSYLDVVASTEVGCSNAGLSLSDRTKDLRKFLGGTAKDKLVDEVNDLAFTLGYTFTTGATLPQKITQLEKHLLGKDSPSENGEDSHSLLDDIDKMILELGLTVPATDPMEVKIASLEKHIFADPDAAAKEPLLKRVAALYKEIFGSP